MRHWNLSAIKGTHTVQLQLKWGCMKLPDISAFQGSTYALVKYLTTVTNPVSFSTPLGWSHGVSHKGYLQERKQNTVWNTFDSLQDKFIWNVGVTECLFCSHEHAAFPSAFSYS
jgi:hypothetical protein